ncbi:hypothetical protein LCGC14_2041530 [marine sediment metagenome]|uniref:HNH nuclease domain-containing protein n=1 Tax=marine sediment metagenome TaxID=412755 RepID=A0A0F9ES15_9ZZZZ
MGASGRIFVGGVVRCTECGEFKPLACYPNAKGCVYGRAGKCRACQRERYRDYSQTPAAKATRHRCNHSERGKERFSRYRQSARGKATRKRLAKAYAQTEAGRATAQRAAVKYCQSEHGRRIRVQTQARRDARQAALPATLTDDEWQAILMDYDYRCAYCRTPFNDNMVITQDHVLPLSRGGPYTEANIVPACGACNSQYRARLKLKPVPWKYHVA